MAHHLGMSMLALTNYLCDYYVVRLFMAEPAMRAYRGLLAEKLPLNAPVITLPEGEMPKTDRLNAGQWAKRGGDIDFEDPESAVLSNGSYNIMLTESGITRPMWGETLVYRSPRHQVGDQLVVDGYATLYPTLETYLTATNVAVVGRSAVDPPLVLRLHDLDERAHHLCEIVVCGTVVDIRDDEIDPHYGIIQLKDDDLLLPVYFRKDDLGLSLTPESAIEAQVTVRGIFHRTVRLDKQPLDWNLLHKLPVVHGMVVQNRRTDRNESVQRHNVGNEAVAS